ncbi:hypothetical protein ACRALDRAFT_2020829 [Sodiomyces alcalophilus JCM 7366]|uniref:uncharacterized protein n=1 Tax=Sodiomyces alcalophilus JCM 7366 TaxID=591952 RepID=UPI0039B67533
MSTLRFRLTGILILIFRVWGETENTTRLLHIHIPVIRSRIWVRKTHMIIFWTEQVKEIHINIPGSLHKCLTRKETLKRESGCFVSLSSPFIPVYNVHTSYNSKPAAVSRRDMRLHYVP